ncbi:MAG: hypothetical protein GKC04_08765 [Methanomicrobiales archaeon]|nr:hypothetical protein [Methanomicrobiales archaeon]
MSHHDHCGFCTTTPSGVAYCTAYHPDTCPYPARFCAVRDRRDAAMAVGQAHETLLEILVKGF